MRLSFLRYCVRSYFSFFFFNDPATTEIYTLSLHDALPISDEDRWHAILKNEVGIGVTDVHQRIHVIVANAHLQRDRKSTRLNSSHQIISYAVFCLKKKKKKIPENTTTPSKPSTLILSPTAM